MRSSKKGNQWYFGMKAHVGVDAKSGLVHTAGVTTGSVHDAKVMDHLIREDDRAVALLPRSAASAPWFLQGSQPMISGIRSPPTWCRVFWDLHSAKAEEPTVG